ncbi:hypothetical protein HBI56_178320 [Parastagonospora nodorum]|uniref:Uncharacterized protein n=1 Tax=Phaeosphaeria nodorum (strain SN15 / ATCC MYA-4574 / FGSC 10173) TaxID=321614 RepID=A0A7U2EWZ0_PHANO|nr:hypothetical protein HBH56_046980 [Parastagonospora nodorum]QRC92570.1 hypothetical protein JI435_083750 [Parastagonospora nodorum SN15]KAH3933125.1 hypothetical protein HBH54_074720 [Parastagonospora nodorum]KAH3946171.1 hypothetical protein HBH53_133860 [Parastagonospora nodorum]KAH3973268.1 hypothetical protein HBH52_146780 [Parastagonospora nodorum]
MDSILVGVKDTGRTQKFAGHLPAMLACCKRLKDWCTCFPCNVCTIKSDLCYGIPAAQPQLDYKLQDHGYVAALQICDLSQSRSGHAAKSSVAKCGLVDRSATRSSNGGSLRPGATRAFCAQTQQAGIRARFR